MEPTNVTEKQVDICLGCGCVMGMVVTRTFVLGMIREDRQVRCMDCGFLAYFNDRRLVKQCPYRTPVERPTPEGKAPEMYRRWYEEQQAGGRLG